MLDKLRPFLMTESVRLGVSEGKSAAWLSLSLVSSLWF